MAKTIMVSNEVYEELKRRKGSRSFSRIIKESIDGKPKIMTMKEFCDRFAGTLPADDTEYDEALKDSRKMWSEWQKRLEKEIAQEERESA